MVAPASPPKIYKGKGVVGAELPRPEPVVGNSVAVEAARHFVHRQARHSKLTKALSSEAVIKVLPSLEGLSTHFHPKTLAAAQAKDRNEDFA